MTLSGNDPPGRWLGGGLFESSVQPVRLVPNTYRVAPDRSMELYEHGSDAGIPSYWHYWRCPSGATFKDLRLDCRYHINISSRPRGCGYHVSHTGVLSVLDRAGNVIAVQGDRLRLSGATVTADRVVQCSVGTTGLVFQKLRCAHRLPDPAPPVRLLRRP